jgi:hypothetical protein
MADVTADMNDRERKCFAETLRQFSKSASEAAEGLEKRDDKQFFTGYMNAVFKHGDEGDRRSDPFVAAKRRARVPADYWRLKNQIRRSR